MSTYADLDIESYYLVIENEGDDIILVQPLMETDACVLLMNIDEYENTFWRKKEDTLFELVDELSEDQVEEYESIFGDDEEEDEEDDF
jgi:hypothetical protein